MSDTYTGGAGRDRARVRGGIGTYQRLRDAGRRARTMRRSPFAGALAGAPAVKPAKGLAISAPASGAANGFAIGADAAGAGVEPNTNAGALVEGAGVGSFGGSVLASDVEVSVDLNSDKAAPKMPLDEPSLGLEESVAGALGNASADEVEVPSTGALDASKRSRSALSSGSSSNSTPVPSPRLGPRYGTPRREGFPLLGTTVTLEDIFGKFLNPSNRPFFKTRSTSSVGCFGASKRRSRVAYVAARPSETSEVRSRCAEGASSSSTSLDALFRFALGHGVTSSSSTLISFCTTDTSNARSPRARFNSPPSSDGLARPLDGVSRPRLRPIARAAISDASSTRRAIEDTPGDVVARAKLVLRRLGTSGKPCDEDVDAGEDASTRSTRYVANTRRTLSIANEFCAWM